MTLTTGTRPAASALARVWWAVALRGLLALLFGVTSLIAPGLALTTLAILFGLYALLDGVAAVVSGLRGYAGRGPLLLLGLLGVAAGALTVAAPDVTARLLLTVIAWWAILTGALEVIAAYRFRDEIPGAWEWLIAASGLLSMLLGALLFLFPASGARLVDGLIGGYAALAGVTLLVLAFRLRAETTARR